MTTLRGPRVAFPEDATLSGLVEARADRTPDAVAVIDGDRRLTYAELDARANRLAHRLVSLGVLPDAPVAVCLERSAELVVALLGVLKAGGACLPLDPSYPAPRLAFMLTDAAPPVLLAQEHLVGRVPAYPGHVVCLDAGREELADHPPDRPATAAGPGHLAYVIYTSGSTGEPKGVMLTHRGLVNHNVAVSGLYRLGDGDRVAQFCSISFDVSVEEIFPTLASGGAVVLRPDDVPILGSAWPAWLQQVGVTVLNLPTAYWHEWVRDLTARGERVPACVRLVIVGGEKALGPAYRTWLTVGGDRIPWINAYGPAEASVLATAYQPPRGQRLPDDRDPPIGRPLANTTVHLLDPHGEPVPEGAPGDLHIGGVGVARGYLNRPELTAERFVPDPFSDRAGARLYRTGDLVRLLPDGNLTFVGRTDEQVKVRGFRIELPEVESALSKHPGVAEAVVVAREDEPGVRRLVAYAVGAASADDPLSSVDLRRFLADRLPRYMVPSAFVHLDALPLTPNGKVARDALPPPADVRTDLSTVFVAPRTRTEEAIADVWSRVLGVEGIGVDDDFFDLGGHSLQATQVIAEVRQARHRRRLQQRPHTDGHPEGLAAAVDVGGNGRAGGQTPPLVPQPRRAGERLPLTLSQQQMWRLQMSADPPGLYNVTALHRFTGRVDEAALRRALAHVVERHETLRTGFDTHSGEPYQSVAPSAPLELTVVDLGAAPPDQREGELHRRIAAQDAAPFDVGEPPLLRACWYRLGRERSVLAATMDHLICDGTSAYVFLSEVTAAYDALAAGQAPGLRPLTLQYPDFALWQRRWLTEERLEAQVEYWRQKLAGMPLGPAVPFDRVPETPSRRIVVRDLAVPPPLYDRLEALARATRSTVFTVSVAAAQALFSRVGGQTDVVLSTTLSGRQRSELEGLIGCFHGVGRIRTDLSGDPTFETVVARARDSVMGLLEHQDVPFMRIRQAVQADFPTDGPAILASVPIDFQYFHTAHDAWAPGTAVVERPGADKGPDELFFRGQLHPLNLTFLDDGTQLWGHFSYKTDFYDDDTIERMAEGLQRVLETVTRDPAMRLSKLPVDA